MPEQRPGLIDNAGGQVLQPHVFATDSEPSPRHRFDAWRSHYNSFNQIDVGPDDVAHFAARNEVWSLGDIALSRNIGPKSVFTRSSRHVRRDSLDHWVIRVASVGVTKYRSASANFATRPNVPFLFSLAEASLSERSDADWISLYIPRDSFPDLTVLLDRVGQGPLKTPMASLLGNYLMLLEKQMRSMTVADIPAVAEATRAMVSACMSRNVGDTPSAPHAVDMGRRERVRQIIDSSIGSPELGAAQISQQAGISRSQLYRMFEPHGGVARYIQQKRLRAAHTLLSKNNGEHSIRAIAERVGFSDLSSFSRAFRRKYNYSPSDAQASIRDEAAGAEFLRPPSTGEFGQLLRHLGPDTRMSF